MLLFDISQISSARLTMMRHDELNQEANDHGLSFSCPCFRHRSAKAPKRRRTILFEAPSLLFEALLRFEALLQFEAPTSTSCCCSMRNEILAPVHTQERGTDKSKRHFGTASALR
jgi:hypothetical protein